jgi:tRNA pseudouridine32 synthase/23S rRNA pseudouridine746 synthase
VAVVYFEPAPVADDVPPRFPSPFASEPHPLAIRAAEELRRELQAGLGAQLGLEAPGGGKMFGALVVADRAGRVGYVRAFSGMVAGRWEIPGFVPPAFAPAARDAFWPAGERELAAIDARLADHHARTEPQLRALAELDARHTAELEALRRSHRERRHLRHAARDANLPREDLDRESRGDRAARRRLAAAHATERAPLAARAAAAAVLLADLAAARARRSRELWLALQDTYVLANASGQRRSLREMFAPAQPPGGAGDCAAPKLLAFAFRAGLRPIALAELWCGAPPATGGRHDGGYYPPCRGKCAPILAHMLTGIHADPDPIFGASPTAADEPRTLYEDRWVAVVVKPAGLLSVPGRGDALRDSVLTRLRARYPQASGPLLVHRLDLDVGGLLLCAKDADTYAALQRLFARREIDKRYVAWLDGDVRGDAGVVELALRVDLDDRPRQIVDPIHGKAATTEWHVLARAGGRTRVALIPRTGRAHQLRVHAAHPDGIGAPIVGDRLYGRAGDRLLLHAAGLRFVHPHTHAVVAFEDAPSF